MNKEFDSIVLKESNETMNGFHKHSLFMGSALVCLNLLLMSCVGVYWTNNTVHQIISGRPL